jgi:hydrogenase maturation protease
MTTPDTLVLGLGNDLVADDGFGPAVARACAQTPGLGDDVIVEEAAAAGFRLLDLLSGYRRALILDVVQTGRSPAGTLFDWPVAASAAAWTLGGSHQCDLATALSFGRALGFKLPEEVSLLVAEASDLLTVREELSPPVAAAVPRARALVAAWLDRTGPFSPPARRNHEEPRTLS